MPRKKQLNTSSLMLDGHKLAWHTDRVKDWLAGKHIAPITIDCSLTQACTYKCVYCYGQLQYNQGAALSRATIFQFLDDCADIGVKGVSFVSDGESTCSPHLYEAIIRGQDNGLDMALGTNGYLLAEQQLPVILPALTYLRFNISAAEPARYAEIHGCKNACYQQVINTISKAVTIKKDNQLAVTIGLQMVLLPEFKDQILPLAKLGKTLGVDYLVIKHCSDDENSSLGVNYCAYESLIPLLHEAEELSAPGYLVKAKWSKILSGGTRTYKKCFGPPFILQLSGTGLVAPCGMLFNEKYKEFHIGNINQTSFKQIWLSEKYQRVMRNISATGFNPQTQCGTLCLQHKVNEYLAAITSVEQLTQPPGPPPQHINFI